MAPRFIQIAVAAAESSFPDVYALDETGQVWSYAFEEVRGGTPYWYRLSPRRKEDTA